jgi:hypothetical protein
MLPLLAAWGCSTPGHRKSPAPAELSLDDFAAEARAGTARYASQQAAIADGFRRVGGDFPAMGEHWVNLPQVMADSFTAARPAVLTYIRVDGVPRLAGVAYTKFLDPNQHPPEWAPARGQWHEHNGSIVDESFAASHEAVLTDGGPRLAILHAWIWIENPDGVFVTDNWALPFARLGRAAPNGAERDAARAAALGTEAAAYYRDAIDATLSPTTIEQASLDSVLAQYQRQTLAAVGRGGALTPQATADLSQLWESLWRALDDALPQRTAALHDVRRRVSGMGH